MIMLYFRTCTVLWNCNRRSRIKSFAVLNIRHFKLLTGHCYYVIIITGIITFNTMVKIGTRTASESSET